MIGVAKNQSVIRFASMSLMSRKCTVSAESISANPRVRTYCTSTTNGNHTSSPAVSGARNHTRKNTRIGSARKKCTVFAVTVTIGRISAGNRTFLIRLPPEMSTPDDSMSDAENHVHGSNPQNMNSGYGSVPCGAAGMTYLNTNVEIVSRSSGVMNEQ